ncbi:MAG: hypothetical protein JWO38_4879 [Gemmataceae bacterium]|nr:hypothetical protein [Gemmataceae bacterium]
MSTLARILDVCDSVVSMIQTAWVPAAPSAVSRVYDPDIGLTAEDVNTRLAGRQVLVFPTKYESPAQASRDMLWRKHRVTVLTVERYTDGSGSPPVAWMDARVGFVEQMIFNPLRNPALVLAGQLVTQAFPAPDEAAEADVYDIDIVIQDRAFWAEVRVVLQEPTDLTGATI